MLTSFNSGFEDTFLKVSLECFIFEEVKVSEMFHVPVIWNVHVLDCITKYNLVRFFLLEKLQGNLMSGQNLGLQDWS